jgi:hypothetical protein
MGLATDFAKRPCGALWRGAMTSPIANMDSTSSREMKGKKNLSMST